LQDILPTLIDLCGLKKPQNADFDGTSLASLLKGEKSSLADRFMIVQYGQILKKWDCCAIWGKWRLVKGTELYDIHADPGQKNDVAVQNADVLKKMRDYYEAWWERVESKLREYAPITIGSEQENPVNLCCSDWQDVYCDNPRSVLTAQGGPQGGPWNVLVERDGEYEVTLRRWPVEIDLPLSAACPEKKMTAGSLPAGVGLPIARAQLKIAGQQHSATAAAADKTVIFRITLKGGMQTQLHGWFQDSEGRDLCGAYYAYVRRI
jgi:arylsulfatase